MAAAVHDSVPALLAGLESRVPLPDAPGKSGATLERVVLDGESMVLKRLDRADDWTLRVTGQIEPPPITLWRLGVLSQLPANFEQPIVGCAIDPDGTAWLLMHDISDSLFPDDGSPISLDAHFQLLDHLADLSATWWERPDIPIVVEPMVRYLELSPWMGQTEAALGSSAIVPRLVLEGWDRLRDVAPEIADIVLALAWDPSPLVAALDETPQTFVHGNWKLDNLGISRHHRTVIFDWETPGRGTACAELAWYLAINCDRLPISKEETIDEFRLALERHSIDTEEWWDRQLALALLGGLVHFGWEKALGGRGAEFEWWERRVHDALPFLER